MHTPEIQVSDRQTEIPNQLAVNADAALLDVGLGVVFREQVDTRGLCSRRRYCREIAWISWTRIRHDRARKRDARYLNAILRVRGPQHDRRRAPKENSVAAAQYSLFIKPVTKAKARREVISIAHGRDRAQSHYGQRGAGIIHARIGQLLIVVP